MVDVVFYNFVLSVTLITVLYSTKLIIDYFNQSDNRKIIIIMAEELFFKVKELLSKQDVEKLNLLTVTLGIDGEQIKPSKGRKYLKYIVIKVLEGKLDEEGKTDEEKYDIFKHMIEDLKLMNK